jgi:hypothetical protein
MSKVLDRTASPNPNRKKHANRLAEKDNRKPDAEPADHIGYVCGCLLKSRNDGTEILQHSE